MNHNNSNSQLYTQNNQFYNDSVNDNNDILAQSETLVLIINYLTLKLKIIQ